MSPTILTSSSKHQGKEAQSLANIIIDSSDSSMASKSLDLIAITFSSSFSTGIMNVRARFDFK
jgi:hypothetical protein